MIHHAHTGGNDVAFLHHILIGVNTNAEGTVQAAGLQAAVAGSAAAGPDHIALVVFDHILSDGLAVRGIGIAGSIVVNNFCIRIDPLCTMGKAVSIAIEAGTVRAEDAAELTAGVLSGIVHDLIAVGRNERCNHAGHKTDLIELIPHPVGITNVGIKT